MKLSLSGEVPLPPEKVFMFGQVMLFCLLVFPGAGRVTGVELPGAYFRLLEVGIAQVEERLAADPSADLQSLEARGDGWRLFPHVVLVAGVLYAKPDPSNHRYKDSKVLSLAMKIGDLLASENERGSSDARMGRERDTYMWLEAYRLLEQDLGEERRRRWRRELERNVANLAAESAQRTDFPGYQSPFIGTSPNHLALWASTVYLAGRVFGHRDWKEVGARVLHRFAAEEQSPNGYWGEHERLLPTPGYDYNTYASVALYKEFSQDPAALEALRRGLDFHKFFTYPDGTPVEVIDDRNRYTIVAGWGSTGLPSWSGDKPPGGNDESASKGQFGFSNFPDGRRYAEFLTAFFQEGRIGYEDLGRIAQNALYYHRGPREPIPQDLRRYARRLTVPAGIRKSGPWVVCLSGLISTQAVNNQFYLDRQGSLSIFHSKHGLIITGANSKRQPELATFSEKLGGQVFYMPISSRLQMSEERDRLSLAYNTFFSDLYVPTPSDNEVTFRFVINGKGKPAEEAQLNLQLCLKAGEMLETGAGRKILLGSDRVELQPEALAGWIRHHGWKLQVDPTARLTWPVYPHNPYANAPETMLEHAVGMLIVPLRLKTDQQGRYVRPGDQEIPFTLEAE